MSYISYRSDSIDWTVQDCVNGVQDWLSVTRGDFNRYPADAIYKALNNGAARFTLLTECLTMPVLVVAKAYIQNYRLHDCVQKIQSARYYYGSDRNSYQELTIKGSMRELQDEVQDFRGSYGSPAYYLFPSYKAGNVVQFGIAMFPSTDGASFNAANSYVKSFNPGTTWPGAVTGQAGSGIAANPLLIADSSNGNIYRIISTGGVIGLTPVLGAGSILRIADSLNGNVYQVISTNGILGLQQTTGAGGTYPILDSSNGNTYIIISTNGLLGLTNMGSGAGPSYIDNSGRDMISLGVTVGLIIYNATNPLYPCGIITAITTTHSANDTIVAAMGTNWSTNDQMVIPLPNWGLAIDVPAGTINTITSRSGMGTIGDFKPFDDNMVLDVIRKPFPMLPTMPSFVPELPADYVEAAVAFAVYQLGRSAFKGLIQQTKADEGKQRFSELVEQYKELSPFQDESESATTYFDIYS